MLQQFDKEVQKDPTFPEDARRTVAAMAADIREIGECIHIWTERQKDLNKTNVKYVPFLRPLVEKFATSVCFMIALLSLFYFLIVSPVWKFNGRLVWD